MSSVDVTGALLAQKYRLLRALGSGRAGTVYYAQRRMADPPVAVKLLHPRLMASEDIRARFGQDVGVAARLQHPNILEIQEYGEDRELGALYLVSAFVAGGSLARVMDSESPLPMRRIVVIVSRILEALAAAHAGGVVHRNLKPSNVLIGEGDEVLLCDFGLARLAPYRLTRGARDSQVRIHQVSPESVGTPEYSSPEHVRGEDLDGRSDLYSAGVILYQLLTGTLPFKADSPFEVAVMQCGFPPPPPSGFGPVNRALEEVCLKALSKTRDARFQSAAEMRHALEAALSRQSEPSGPRQRASAPPRRRALSRRETIEMSRLPRERARPAEASGWAEDGSIAPAERRDAAARGAIGKRRPALALAAGALLGVIAWASYTGRLPGGDEAERAEDVRARTLVQTIEVPRAVGPIRPIAPEPAPSAGRALSSPPTAASAAEPAVASVRSTTVATAVAAPQPGGTSSESASAAPIHGAGAGTVTPGDTYTLAPVSRARLRAALDPAGLNQCYRAWLREQAGPQQTFTGRLDITVDAGGQIRIAALRATDKPKPLRKCIEGVALGGRVPDVTIALDASIVLTFRPE